jgi:hypothetical protein
VHLLGKGHDQPFKETFFGFESCIPYISLLDGNLVVVILHVNIVEELVPLELVKKVINSGNWVPVHDCDFV